MVMLLVVEFLTVKLVVCAGIEMPVLHSVILMAFGYKNNLGIPFSFYVPYTKQDPCCFETIKLIKIVKQLGLSFRYSYGNLAFDVT